MSQSTSALQASSSSPAPKPFVLPQPLSMLPWLTFACYVLGGILLWGTSSEASRSLGIHLILPLANFGLFLYILSYYGLPALA
ncbi:MAG: hypothetical protein AAGJ35_15595, partial [Myxococcota bacterium]